MSEQRQRRVVDKNGLQGTIEQFTNTDSNVSQVLIHLDNRQQAVVPSEMLVELKDGGYFLPLSLQETAERQSANFNSSEAEHAPSEKGATTLNEIAIPVIAEEVRVDKRTVESGRVRIRKFVREHQELVDEPLLADEVRVERVPVNRYIDKPVAVRYEGETMIVPLFEEVLVVEKRLMLKEELHITKQLVEMHKPQQVTLRTEEVTVERADARAENQQYADEQKQGGIQ